MGGCVVMAVGFHDGIVCITLGRNICIGVISSLFLKAICCNAKHIGGDMGLSGAANVWCIHRADGV